jgi:hypothetical protein
MRSNLASRLAKLERVAPPEDNFPWVVCVDRWDDAALIQDGGNGDPWAGRPLGELLAAKAAARCAHGTQFIVGVNLRVVLGLDPEPSPLTPPELNQ